MNDAETINRIYKWADKNRQKYMNNYQQSGSPSTMQTFEKYDDICDICIAAEKGVAEEDETKKHGKGDKYRECFLNARAQLALEVYLAERQDNNPYLFPRAKYAGDVVKMTKGTERRKEPEWYKNPENIDESDHIAFGTIESIVRKIGRRVGVEKVHPHRFRRTGATMALRTGMPLTTVSKLLGHESIETTQIYLDISDEELEAAHKKFVV